MSAKKDKIIEELEGDLAGADVEIEELKIKLETLQQQNAFLQNIIYTLKSHRIEPLRNEPTVQEEAARQYLNNAKSRRSKYLLDSRHYAREAVRFAISAFVGREVTL